jgi:hypothetical protein
MGFGAHGIWHHVCATHNHKILGPGGLCC